MAIGKAINQFDVATSAENKRVLGYDTDTNVTCQIPARLISTYNCSYYYTLRDAATAIRQNDLSSTLEKTDIGVCIEVIYLFSTIVINLLSNISISSIVTFKKSVIINTNGFNVVFQGTGRIYMNEKNEFYNSESPESFVLNAKGSTFTTSSVDGSPFMFELYCSKVTINGGTFIHHCNNNYSLQTQIVGKCETFCISEKNCIATLTECIIKTSGNLSATCIDMSKGRELNLNNCTCYAAALTGSGYVYDPGQTYSKALNVEDVATCNIVKGYYSGECFAATFKGQRTIINNSTFESCDHGVYFCGDKAHGFEVKFKHLKWSSLKCALLEFPFKEGAIKTKSNYTPENPDYCNYGLCYLGNIDNRVKVALHRCTEINDNSNAKIVLSSNYNYKDTYLYLSSHDMLNGLRLDGVNANGAKGHLILGWGVTGEVNHTNNALGNGYVDDTMFAQDKFTTIESITDEIYEIPTNLLEGQVTYDQVIRTQAEFDALKASPTWLGAVTVALVGEFSSSTSIIVPETVKRIDGYKCKITNTLECNGCSINDIELVSNNTGFSGSNSTYTNCTGTGNESGDYSGFFGSNNTYTNCTGTGGYAFDGSNSTYTNCTAIGSYGGIKCDSSATDVFMIIKNCKFPSKTGVTDIDTTAVDISSNNVVGVVKDCVYNEDFDISVGTGIVTEDNFAITGLTVDEEEEEEEE